MVKDVYYGKTLRKSYARHQEILEMPHLLEVQKRSYRTNGYVCTSQSFGIGQ